MYPGTRQHQALLSRIDSFYTDDPRILALTIFGSLPRGTWDAYSDLDLDVVICDNARVDVLPEVHSLCASLSVIGERAVLIVPNNNDAADVVLASLLEFSIRYHSLANTSPNIVESVRLLHGRIALETIKAAGEANVAPRSHIEANPVDSFLRLALAADREINRQHFWQALPLLDSMRTLIVEMFASAHGGGRPFNVFQAKAPRTLHEELAAVLPESTLASLQHSLFRLLEIVEREHRQLGKGEGLSAEQQLVFAEIRQRRQSSTFIKTDQE